MATNSKPPAKSPNAIDPGKAAIVVACISALGALIGIFIQTNGTGRGEPSSIKTALTIGREVVSACHRQAFIGPYTVRNMQKDIEAIAESVRECRIAFQSNAVGFSSAARPADTATFGKIHQNIVFLEEALKSLRSAMIANVVTVPTALIEAEAARSEHVHLMNVFGAQLGIPLPALPGGRSR